MASLIEHCEDVFSYIHNRWIDPSHQISIKNPEYGIGRYYDTDTKMLFANFQLLVDYVEIECAGMYKICTKNPPFTTWSQKAKSMIDFIPGLCKVLPPSRNALQGLFYLKWEQSLGDNSPSQAKAAQEIFELYKFWVRTRPNRINPWNLPAEMRDEHPIQNGQWVISKKYSRALHKAQALEDKYNREDNRMLIRLINIRHCMWT